MVVPEATASIEGAGFSVVAIVEVPSSEVPAGRVVSQAPPAGEPLEPKPAESPPPPPPREARDEEGEQGMGGLLPPPVAAPKPTS